MTGSSALRCTGQFSYLPIESMTVPYLKPHLTIDEQVALLKERGMKISDESKAKKFLQKIGYYRLSGYWYPFRESKLSVGADGKPVVTVLDTFRHGAELHQAVDLYVFDKKLRILLLDALERIEIALRVSQIAIVGHRDQEPLPSAEQGIFSYSL